MSAELDREYHRLRKNLLRQRRYYIKKGFSESNLPKIPSIPQKITEASIRRLEKIIISPEKRKTIRQYKTKSKQYKQEIGEIWRIDFEKEIPSFLKEIEIKAPEKATAKDLTELKRTVKRAKTYKKNEKKKAALEKQLELERRWRIQEKREREIEIENEVLPKPIGPNSDDFWEDWEEGPPRDWTQYDNIYLPDEEDILTDNLEETLIDFGLYNIVEDTLENWEPLENWTPAFAAKKAHDRDTALSVFLGAVERDGKKSVAKRINEYGSEIIEIVNSICYDSDQDRVRFNINRFSEIINNRAISFEENIAYTEASDNYGIYN